MIYTSNFSNVKNLNKNDCVSISIGTPIWFNGEIFKGLQPTWNLVMNHKKGIITDDEYTKLYYEIVLNKLKPQEIIDKLDNKILLCWCKKNNFCHRKIVSNWLNNYQSDICSEI